MSAYPEQYTFTREQLTAVLEDVLHETHTLYLHWLAQDDAKANAKWPDICCDTINEVFARLYLDATRHFSHGNQASLPERATE